MHNTKLIVFDLDGTLADTIGDIACSLNAALAGLAYPTLSEWEVQKLVGHGLRQLCSDALPEEKKDDSRRVFRALEAHYSEHCCDRTRPYDGVQRLLVKLRAAGKTLAVASNKPHKNAMQVVNACFPRDSFSMILGSMDKFPNKPAPDMLRFIMDYFSVSPEETLFVGDSEVDVAFAKNAGVDCIAVSWGFRSRKTLLAGGAKRIADDAEELLAAILKEG